MQIIFGEDQGLTERGKIIFLSTTTLIIFSGFLGNTLILVVMCNKKFDKTSTSVYLSVLAVSDSLVLFSESFAVLFLSSNLTVGNDSRTLHISLCLILKFLIYWSRHLSSFCLMSATIERLIAVLKPHK